VRPAVTGRDCYTALAVNPMRRHLRPATWLALAALWALALLPAVSHALAAQRGDAWAAVCTTQGLQRVALSAAAGDGQPQPAGPVSHWEHCPLCQAAQAAPLPPAPAELGLQPVLAVARVAPPAARVARGDPLWSRAPARAPPQLA
jgi:hypothetical protein